MKPREFDDLIRQKFDQNDFAYNPANWDSLAEELDGRAKKRGRIMWLWLPALGMAASVALAIGVSSLLRLGAPAGNQPGYAAMGKFGTRHHATQPVIADEQPQVAQVVSVPPVANTGHIASVRSVKPSGTSAQIGLKFRNIKSFGVAVAATEPVQQPLPVAPVLAAKTDLASVALPKHPVAEPRAMRTFRQEVHAVADRKPLNLSVILSGGISQGNKNSGYTAGATVRKMINDKVYVESDIAFTTSDNVQHTMYMSYGNSATSGVNGSAAAKPATSASKTTGDDAISGLNTDPSHGVIKSQDISYNSYYAQVSPAIGYKVMKRMSIGMGPDFQKMLVDNRPATSTVDRGNLQVAPTFDVGFIGKTEYALTQRVKAAVSYRKGINSVITTSNKYIDRDYLQFQMRCTIFNK